MNRRRKAGKTFSDNSHKIKYVFWDYHRFQSRETDLTFHENSSFDGSSRILFLNIFALISSFHNYLYPHFTHIKHNIEEFFGSNNLRT